MQTLPSLPAFAPLEQIAPVLEMLTPEVLTAAWAEQTGLDLQADVLRWMNGDYALFGRLIPVESNLRFTFDAAAVWESADSDAAHALVDALTHAVDASGLDYTPSCGPQLALWISTIEQTMTEATPPPEGVGENLNLLLRGTPAADSTGCDFGLTLPEPLRRLFPPDFPREVLDSTPELDLLISSSGEAFALGSRRAVEDALFFIPLGEPSLSLADDSAYRYAMDALLLEDPTWVGYIHIAGLVEVLPLLPADEVAGLELAVRVLESATFSSAVDENGVALQRFTLTLKENLP